jgi:hypothetical protein
MLAYPLQAPRKTRTQNAIQSYPYLRRQTSKDTVQEEVQVGLQKQGQLCFRGMTVYLNSMRAIPREVWQSSFDYAWTSAHWEKSDNDKEKRMEP